MLLGKSRWFVPYAVAVGVIGVVLSAGAVAVSSLEGVSWPGAAALVFSTGVMLLTLPGWQTSLDGGAYRLDLASLPSAALACCGPLWLFVVVTAVESAVVEWQRGGYLLRGLFNHAHRMLAATAAWLVLWTWSGSPVHGTLTAPPIGAAIAVLLAANLALIAVDEAVFVLTARLFFGRAAAGLLGPSVATANVALQLGFVPLVVTVALIAPWSAGLAVVVVAAFSWSVCRQIVLNDALTIDELTGLATRRVLKERAAAALPSASEARPVSLVLIDLDGFKAVNDSFGHPAGDLVLTAVGQRMRDVLDQHDTPGALAVRLGGDEFALLLPASPPAAGEAIAEALRCALDEPVDVGQAHVCVGMSFGIAAAPDDATSLSGLLSSADQRLYAAKRALYGHDRPHHGSASAHETPAARLPVSQASRLSFEV